MMQDNHQVDAFDKTVALGGRILKKTLWGVGIILAIVALVSGAFGLQYYFHNVLPKNQVSVLVRAAKVPDECAEEFPVLVAIKNESSRTVTKVTIYPVAHRDGYSTNLASGSIESDKIVPPDQVHAICWRGELDYSARNQYNASELVWESGTYYIDFK